MTAVSQSPIGRTSGAPHARLGQLYNRQIVKGLLLMLGLPIFGKVGLSYAFLGAFEAMSDLRYLLVMAAGGLILVVAAALWIYAVVDAHRCAQEYAASSPAVVTDGG